MNTRAVLLLVLSAMWVLSPIASAGETPAQKKAREKREALALLNNARQKLQRAKSAATSAKSDLARHQKALPGAERAFHASQETYHTTRATEGAITQRLKAEIESDPRPAGVRERLTAAQNAEHERRDELMRTITRTEEYETHVAAVDAIRSDLARLQAGATPDTKKLAEASQNLMASQNALDDFTREALAKDRVYRELIKDLDDAKDVAQEVERDIRSTITSNPERAAATQKAAAAKINYETKRRAYEDTKRKLSSASGRLRVALQAISDSERDIRIYAARAGVRVPGTKVNSKNRKKR